MSACRFRLESETLQVPSFAQTCLAVFISQPAGSDISPDWSFSHSSETTSATELLYGNSAERPSEKGRTSPAMGNSRLTSINLTTCPSGSGKEYIFRSG